MNSQQLLERWRQALGGREALEAIRGLHLRMAAQTGGLRGRIDAWRSARGETRQQVDLGVLKLLSVFDGERGWQRDGDGNVRELAGDEQAAAITGAYLDSFSHLLPGRMTGDVRATEGGLVLHPTGGRVVTVAFDEGSGLPRTLLESAQGRPQTTTLSDWRDVAGVRLPFRVVQSSGDPRYDLTLEVEEVEVDPDFDPALFAEPEAGAGALTLEETIELPIELVGSHVFLAGKLEGRTLNVLVDTGAAHSVLNSRTAAAMGLAPEGRIEGRGAGEGSQDVGFLQGMTLHLGRLELADLTLATVDLAPMEPLEGRDLDLIVGYELIRRAVLEIDYPGLSLRLHPPEEYRHRGSGARIPLTLENNHPNVRAALPLPSGEVEATFLIDTGANATLLFHGPFSDRHDLPRAAPRTIQVPTSVAVGGAANALAGTLPGLKLGPFELTKVPAGFSTNPGGSFQDDTRAGLIGGEILQRFVAIFDYGRRELILEPRDLETPFAHDMSGLQLTADPPAYGAKRVRQVMPDSPASDAGVRPGDRLMAVDGEAADDLQLHRIRERFSTWGGAPTLTLERDGAEHTVELRLRPLI